jgi:nicotinic acid mononucleotide adenylyltransferase
MEPHPIFDDPWFGRLARMKGIDVAAAHGWWPDGLTVEGRNDLIRTDEGTPFDHLNWSLEDLNVIPITTGGFDPIHIGHVAMLNSAVRTAQRLGYHVAGGWVCPDHDHYVATKRTHYLRAKQRCGLVKMAVPEFYAVDEFPSMIAPAILNFSTIIERLAHLIELHHPNASGSWEIWYVVGSDNAHFTAAVAQASFPVRLAVARRGGDTTPLPRGVIDLGSTPGASSTAIREGSSW